MSAARTGASTVWWVAAVMVFYPDLQGWNCIGRFNRDCSECRMVCRMSHGYIPIFVYLRRSELKEWYHRASAFL